METDIFSRSEIEATDLIVVPVGELDEVSSVLFPRCCVVNDNAATFLHFFFSGFVTFLFGFQSVSVDSVVVGDEVVLPEG